MKLRLSKTFYKTTMPVLYNVGAAVVIIGAMFKLLNLSGGTLMLGVGLSMEAAIFLFSALEPQEEALDWTRVYPELAPAFPRNQQAKTTHSLTKQLDERLEQAQINAPLLDHLAASMQRFADNISTVPSFEKVHEATATYMQEAERAAHVMGSIAHLNDKVRPLCDALAALSPDTLSHYFHQLEEMGKTLSVINQGYKQESIAMEAAQVMPGALYVHLQKAAQAMEIASNEALQFKQELALLNEQVTALNAIYAKTLTAFKG